eukprot:scaffold2.g7192.t1
MCWSGIEQLDKATEALDRLDGAERLCELAAKPSPAVLAATQCFLDSMSYAEPAAAAISAQLGDDAAMAHAQPAADELSAAQAVACFEAAMDLASPTSAAPRAAAAAALFGRPATCEAGRIYEAAMDYYTAPAPSAQPARWASQRVPRHASSTAPAGHFAFAALTAAEAVACLEGALASASPTAALALGAAAAVACFEDSMAYYSPPPVRFSWGRFTPERAAWVYEASMGYSGGALAAPPAPSRHVFPVPTPASAAACFEDSMAYYSPPAPTGKLEPCGSKLAAHGVKVVSLVAAAAS